MDNSRGLSDQDLGLCACGYFCQGDFGQAHGPDVFLLLPLFGTLLWRGCVPCGTEESAHDTYGTGCS